MACPQALCPCNSLSTRKAEPSPTEVDALQCLQGRRVPAKIIVPEYVALRIDTTLDRAPVEQPDPHHRDPCGGSGRIRAQYLETSHPLERDVLAFIQCERRIHT